MSVYNFLLPIFSYFVYKLDLTPPLLDLNSNTFSTRTTMTLLYRMIQKYLVKDKHILFNMDMQSLQRMSGICLRKANRNYPRIMIGCYQR